MDSIGKAAQQLETLLKPIVAMIVREVRPADDELSMNAAYKQYGKTWIEDMRNKGNLLVRIKGNRKMISVAEVERLIACEKEMPKPVFKKKGETGFKVITRNRNV